MSTENARVLYTESTTGASVMSTLLNSLADDAAALSDALSNDASTERRLLANFSVSIALQGGARTGSPCRVSLLVVPEINGVYPDVATLLTAGNCVARTSDGTACQANLDAATTARVVSFANVQLPNGNYKVGLLNETGQALAASGNVIWQTGTFSTASITE